jgi:hypothetical protein
MKINEETGVTTIETWEESDRIREQIGLSLFEPTDTPKVWKVTVHLTDDPPEARHVYLWHESLMRRPMLAYLPDA